jgi:hypothetical protein
VEEGKMEVSVEEVTEDQHKRQNGPGSGKTREGGVGREPGERESVIFASRGPGSQVG